jgi:hypothetical protein
MKKREAGLLLAFVILFIATRLVFLGFSEFVYDEEEAKTGSISVILKDGPKLPLLEHQPGDYEGGTLLFGILAIPFMAIFGKPYLGLKLMALATATCLALFSVLWIRKIAGLAGAVVTAVLFLFAVPYIVQVTYIPWGNYAETAMLSAVTFYLLHTIVFDNRRSYARFALLGFLFGLGTWMHYGYLITVLVCLFMTYLANARIFLTPQSAVAFVSSIIGFSPWIVYNVTHHFWGLARFADGVRVEQEHGFIVRFGARFAQLFTLDLPMSYHLIAGNIATTKALSYTYHLLFVGFLIALLIMLRSNLLYAIKSLAPGRRSKDFAKMLAPLVPLAYFFAYTLVFCITEYGLFENVWGRWEPESHVHIFVLLPAMIWVIGVSAGLLFPKRPTAVAIAVGVMVGLGIIGQWSMLDFSKSQSWRLASTFEGEKKVIYMEIGSKWGRRPSDLEPIGSKLDGIDKTSFYFGAGIKYGLDHVGSLQVALDKCAALEDALLPYCWFGVGTGLSSSLQLTNEQLTTQIGAAPSAVRPYLVAGGAVGAIWFGDMEHPFIEQVKQIDFESIAPDELEKELPSFIQGHLDMVLYRPGKD